MTDTADRYRIVPRGAMAATVRSFDFEVRTMVDYDMTYLQDRVIADVFVNGKPCGIYATVRCGDHTGHPQELLEHFGPDLERVVVDEFMGLGYRRKVATLEAEVAALKAHINRPRWWQIRRLWAARKETR